jgi:hypothetical protein
LTVVFTVAVKALRDALTLVGALKVVRWTAFPIPLRLASRFIAPISAVIITVTDPHLLNADSIPALKFVRLAIQ